jgi:hypothetical protein
MIPSMIFEMAYDQNRARRIPGGNRFGPSVAGQSSRADLLGPIDSGQGFIVAPNQPMG